MNTTLPGTTTKLVHSKLVNLLTGFWINKRERIRKIGNSTTSKGWRNSRRTAHQVLANFYCSCELSASWILILRVNSCWQLELSRTRLSRIMSRLVAVIEIAPNALAFCRFHFFWQINVIPVWLWGTSFARLGIFTLLSVLLFFYHWFFKFHRSIFLVVSKGNLWTILSFDTVGESPFDLLFHRFFGLCFPSKFIFGTMCDRITQVQDQINQVRGEIRFFLQQMPCAVHVQSKSIDQSINQSIDKNWIKSINQSTERPMDRVFLILFSRSRITCATQLAFFNNKSTRPFCRDMINCTRPL